MVDSLSRPWRLALDVGVGSIGWAALNLRRSERSNSPGDKWVACSLLDLGVNLFDSGVEDGTPKNTARRTYKAARHRLQSIKIRKRNLRDVLVAADCLPPDSAISQRSLLKGEPRSASIALRDQMVPIDGDGSVAIPAVWAWRWKALRKPGQLTHHELGVILMALASARGQGFSEESDSRTVAPLVSELQGKISKAGCTAFGDYAAEILAKSPGATVRARNAEPNFLSRQMVLDEFRAIRNAQTRLLSPKRWDEIENIIFDQAPLAPPRPGNCPLVKEDVRLERAHPLAQRLKIIQTLRNVRLFDADGAVPEDRPTQLTPDEISQAETFLSSRKSVTAISLFRHLGLKNLKSNYHRGSKTEATDLPGNETNVAAAREDAFGAAWAVFEPSKQRDIVELALSIRGNRTADGIRAAADTWGISIDAARAFIDMLPKGRAAYGLTATNRLLAVMLKEGLSLFDARDREYPQAAQSRKYCRLPYYAIALPDHVFDSDPSADETATDEQRFGHVRNPIVHVALNQIRGLVNALVAEYGAPVEITVELAREISLSGDEKKKLLKSQKERAEMRETAAATIRECGYKPSRDLIDRYVLYCGQDRRLVQGEFAEIKCVYSGRPIESFKRLFSNDVEIDHIVPRRRSHDDSLANKVLAYRDANRKKLNRTPFECWGHTEHWAEIWERAEFAFRKQPKKLARFRETAAQEFTGDFASRHLNDTRYISKMTRLYLERLQGTEYVYATRGSITGRLRKSWELAKLLPVPAAVQSLIDISRASASDVPIELKRHDHRHHAIDAALIGLVDHHTLQYYFEKTESQTDERFPLPWPTFKDELAKRLQGLIVRRKPEHKRGFRYQGQLVEDSRYRLRRQNEKNILSSRTSLIGLAIDKFGNLILGTRSAGIQFSCKEAFESSILRIDPTGRLIALLNWETLQAIRNTYLTSRQGDGDSGPLARKKKEREATAFAWRSLCSMAATTAGGISSVRRKIVLEDPVIVGPEKSAVKSAGYAFAYVIKRNVPNTRYRLFPVAMKDAETDQGPPLKPGEVVVCKLHKGDMLSLLLESNSLSSPVYCTVQGFKNSGILTLTTQYNAARNGGRAVNTVPEIESSDGGNAVNKVFGTWRARIVRPTVLGRLP